MRRGFGHPLRRGSRGAIPLLLRRANELLTTGSFAAAADSFEQLARAAEARGGPRTPFFYLQAGRARVWAGQVAAGMEHLERGLGLFAARGRVRRAIRAGGRLVGELNQRGLTNEAARLKAYLNELVPGFEVAELEPEPARKATLPTHCPGCGAPVRADEVEWIDDVTAECAFCGSPVRGRT